MFGTSRSIGVLPAVETDNSEGGETIIAGRCYIDSFTVFVLAGTAGIAGIGAAVGEVVREAPHVSITFL